MQNVLKLSQDVNEVKRVLSARLVERDQLVDVCELE